MSSIRLPCHKGSARQTNDTQTKNGIINRNGARLRPGQIPYVSHDNGKTRYYADRYYMDAPTALIEYQLEQRRKQREGAVDYCDYCGEKRQTSDSNAKGGSPARPLFDRAAFINSLDLSAVIIATYTIGNLEFLSDTLPALFPHPDRVCKQHVPTLVLHGHRGWKLPTERTPDSVKVPDEWEVEHDDVDCDLKPATIARDDKVDEMHASVQNKAKDTFSMLKKTPTGDTREQLNAATKQSTDREEENMSSESPAERDALESWEPHEIHHGSIKPKSVLTYQGETLDIKSTRKRKRMILKANGTELSRQSPRLGPTKNKRSESPESEQCSRSIRHSPRLNQAIKREHLAEMQKVANIGSTAMDAIHLGSDTEDDECSIKPNYNRNETNTNLNFASLKPAQNKMAKSTITLGLQTPPLNASRNHIRQNNMMSPKLHSRDKEVKQVALLNSKDRSQKQLEMHAAATAPASAATILARSFGLVPDAKLMKPLNYAGNDSDTSDDDSVNDSCYVVKSNAHPTNRFEQTEKAAAAAVEEMDVAPSAVFGGEVYFTQVLPRWIPPKDKKSKKRQSSSDDATPNLETVRGCHHPKFFLLFEKSGSLVVIVSTCNLTPQHAVDASWVQRFEPRSILNSNDGDVDYGMTCDFGYVLADLMKKQSEAAKGMLPDAFLRRYVAELSSGGLMDIPRQYKFEDSHVHLVSTVPGDYKGHLPKKGVASYYNRPPYRHPSITYGPQRVAYILSRIMDKDHIRLACATIPRGLNSVGCGGAAAVSPWLPPSLLTKNERLVIQPTSMSGTWDRWELETIAKSLLQPHWKVGDVTEYNSPLDLLNIVWPNMGHFDRMREKRRVLNECHKAHPCLPTTKKFDRSIRGPCHVFLSSMAFSKLDRVCISRLALFEPSSQLHLNSYETASLHFKSFCRMLKLKEDKPLLKRAACSNKSGKTTATQRESKQQEHISWFMLTSACLSKGAQGQPTPYRPLDSDSMSYANFELGVLFCSRILGDRVNDRLYVYDNDFNGGCQCGSGKRWYKDLLKKDEPNKSPAFLDCIRKIHIPIPYQLRPQPYQQDPDSDVMSDTPYLHEIPPGTGAVGNMKLTPYGRSVASKNNPSPTIL